MRIFKMGRSPLGEEVIFPLIKAKGTVSLDAAGVGIRAPVTCVKY